MTYFRARRAVALAAVLALASVTAPSSGATAGAVAPGPESDARRVVVGADREAAGDALATVRSIFSRSSDVQARTMIGTGGVDATMALRELARHADSLNTEERAQAAAYLARPTSNGGDRIAGFVVKYDVPEATPVCTTDLCLHYVTTTDDAPSLTDVADAAGAPGANAIPDYVDTVLRVMTTVHDTYLDAGYREPRGDGSLGGGNDLIDVYLAEIGTAGLYGYCTTDQPNPTSGPAFYDRWAHCVLDDDYAGFPRTPLENIEVTAAHEYFHATQYAYDAFEDGWFLEATATWAEDEVYDGVNDNVQYLRRSPLTAPFVPLDAFVGGGKYAGFHYGTWSFIRFLTEKYDTKKSALPRLVLDMMRKVDGSLGAKDQYSWQAVSSVLKAQQTTAAEEFLDYSVANRRPRQTYSEGKAQKYPTGPLRASIELTPKKRRTSVSTTTTDHLTSATYRITPRGLKEKSTRLRVVLDMTRVKNGSMAAVTVVPKKGRTTVSTVKLDKHGNGTEVVRFGSKQMKYVEVTLANTSAKTSCYESTTSPFSCYGVPTHDNQNQKLSARLVR